MQSNPARVIREIPVAVKPVFENVTVQKRLKVAAYGRVSTDNEEQLTSYNAQVEYYTSYIQNNPSWEFVKMYADEGVTGTSMKKRKEFMQMVSDAKAGKIDMIITKSISRFARNTVDCLNTVRELRDYNVKVYFEKENIDSMDSTGSLMLSILSSIAEEESRNISTNNKWRIQRTFEKGEVITGRGLYGYTIVDKNKYIVEPQQAIIVNRIFNEFIDGKSISRIASDLTKEKIETPGNGKKWSTSTVYFMLQNEKYIGDAKLQKTFKQDVLAKTKVNNGEMKMYYVSNNHMGIIDKEIFATAQKELDKRKNNNADSRVTGRGKYSSCYAFSRKLRCTECGSLYRRGQQRSRNGEIKFTWICINHADKKECKALPLREKQIEDAFVIAMHNVIDNKSEFLKGLKKDISEAVEATSTFDIEEILKEINEKQAEMLSLSKQKQASKGNREEDERRMLKLMKDLDLLNNKASICDDAENSVLSAKQRIKEIESILAEDNGLNGFSTEIFKRLVDEVHIDKHNLTFKLKCGIDLPGEI